MTTSAKNFPTGTPANIAGFNPDWTNPTRVVSDNDSRASVTLSGDSSDILKVVMPAYTIPTGETVTAIVLGVSGFTDSSAHIDWYDSSDNGIGSEVTLTVGAADVDASTTGSTSRFTQAQIASGLTLRLQASDNGLGCVVQLDSVWVQYISSVLGGRSSDGGSLGGRGRYNRLR